MGEMSRSAVSGVPDTARHEAEEALRRFETGEPAPFAYGVFAKELLTALARVDALEAELRTVTRAADFWRSECAKKDEAHAALVTRVDALTEALRKIEYYPFNAMANDAVDVRAMKEIAAAAVGDVPAKETP